MGVEVIDEISAFYTAHPYPPPVENLDRVRDEWRDANRHKAEYHLLWQNKRYRDDLNILVAGCGTWQSAKYALCHPNSNVIGIDVSTTSLRETEKLKEKYKLDNLHTEQLAIEDVIELGKSFDLVVCTGVLHHLADPDAGLQALASVLNAEGALQLMVYAPYGRAGIYMLQDYCRRLGIGTTTKDIDDLCKVIKELPPQHPLVSILQNSRDSQNADALADALLNPRDRSYSVPELFAFLRNNGLAFGRWYRQAPYLSCCGAIAKTPHAVKLLAVSDEEQFAAMELWRGTINAHSVIAYHENKFGNGIDFDGPALKRYIPIRLPHTICVTEPLPNGAAGVLLNRSHRFHDLFFPINKAEKKMFDAIDGRRTIEEIADVAGGDDAFRGCRTFFEKLWYYDQVTFDASAT